MQAAAYGYGHADACAVLLSHEWLHPAHADADEDMALIIDCRGVSASPLYSALSQVPSLLAPGPLDLRPDAFRSLALDFSVCLGFSCLGSHNINNGDHCLNLCYHHCSQALCFGQLRHRKLAAEILGMAASTREQSRGQDRGTSHGLLCAETETEGETFIAVERGYAEVCRVLLDQPQHAGRARHGGALRTATHKGHAEVCSLLRSWMVCTKTM